LILKKAKKTCNGCGPKIDGLEENDACEIIVKNNIFTKNKQNSDRYSIFGILLKSSVPNFVNLFLIDKEIDETGAIEGYHLEDSILIKKDDILSYKKINKNILLYCKMPSEKTSKNMRALANKIYNDYMSGENACI